MVGLGDTKRKLQTMIDAAEELYAKMNELREQVEDLRTKVDATNRNVDRMEHELERQRAILEALAADAGVDVDQVLADAAIEHADADSATEPTETTDAAGGTAAEPED